MEANRITMTRCDILKDAISEVLSATLQSKEAGASLGNAFPSYRFNNEMGTTDSILASLTKLATDIALTKVDNLLSQNNLKRTLDTIDAQYIGTALPDTDSMDVQTPMASLPKVTFTGVAVSCKKKELEKLNTMLTEKAKVASDLQEMVNAHVQEVGSMRGEITSFSQNAEEVFHMATDVKE